MARDAGIWQTAGGPVRLDRPRIVGVLNATPDSFWEPSRVPDGESGPALERAARLIEEGADILDVGGESTRPGSRPVPAGQEIDRIEPIIRAIRREWPAIPISVDTVKARVARAALEAGAWIVNDVSGLRLDPGLACVIARARAGVIVMHSRGDVATMASYDLAEYGADPVGEIVNELGEAVDRARAGNIPDDSIVIDPGLGFSKRTAHSIACISELGRFASLGWPVLVGPSRKRFVGEIGYGPGPLPTERRLPGTIAACVAARLRGASLFRVHDVKEVRSALAVADAILAAA